VSRLEERIDRDLKKELKEKVPENAFVCGAVKKEARFNDLNSREHLFEIEYWIPKTKRQIEASKVKIVRNNTKWGRLL
jgi:hypothetical protein